MTAPTLPNRTEAELIQRMDWRSEFKYHLTILAHMCDPEITNVVIVWTHSADDLDADYKAARKVFINRGIDNSQTVNTDCDSPLAIVKDIWRYIE